MTLLLHDIGASRQISHLHGALQQRVVLKTELLDERLRRYLYQGLLDKKKIDCFNLKQK